MNCPKCHNQVYYACHNEKCVCRKDIPDGGKILQDDETGEGLICPHCGFIASFSWWEDRMEKHD